MLKGLVEDMMAVCPRATLLNYSNPMSMNMQTISRSSNIQAVGLCHSVQGTFNQIMGNIGEKPEEVAFVCAGINHMAFYLKIEKRRRGPVPAPVRGDGRPQGLRHEPGPLRDDAATGLLRDRIERAQRRVQPLLHPAWQGDDRQISRCRSTSTCAAATVSWTSLSG